MELIGLIGNLKTHEIEKKVREEMTPQKKSTPAISTDKEEEEDEEISLLIRNVIRACNKEKYNHRRRQ